MKPETEDALRKAADGDKLTGPDEVTLVAAGFARFDALGLLWTPEGHTASAKLTEEVGG